MKLTDKEKDDITDDVIESRDVEEDDLTTAYLKGYADAEEKHRKKIKELEEYISIAPNLDKMTATKYVSIQQEAYIRGRAEEQQKAEKIINENYIPVQKIKDKIEENKDTAKRVAGTYQYADSGDDLEEKKSKVIELRTKAEALEELLEDK